MFKKIRKNAAETFLKIKNFSANKKGEAYIDSGVKIIIAVVLGTLLLTTLYTLFNTNVLTNLSSKITELFSYPGT